ncbi:hypothetical protein INT43_003484 [Umbelopsis isabellina]|uniref:Uncharacterized protein n=1 Tax=Mortierella isabellina TaxID=91625 RepID=A0A8H7PS42_MORIS|nr:hypothetical protein INT43_003484 [Umbelopsis isabellina]
MTNSPDTVMFESSIYAASSQRFKFHMANCYTAGFNTRPLSQIAHNSASKDLIHKPSNQLSNLTTRLNTSVNIPRLFHTSPLVRDTGNNNTIAPYHFDTFKFVERLEKEGFNREQSEAIMTSMRTVIDESMANLSKTMVTKAEQEKTVYTYKVDFASLKSEIQLLEKNDFTMMRAENERLQGEIEKLRQRLREEITRTQANVRLDLNLEKGRIRDEASGQEIKIKETDTRIESEIAGLRTQMEAIKFQILQYMVGTITGAGALILAYLRMFR